ncbi:MAG: HU family DNA-binding protein [Planctomycetes bacterium]|nr:HU family DNA-binding protein [Planctomycetota bacterium]
MAKKVVAEKKALTKSDLLKNISEECELSKKQVQAVLDSLNGQIEKSLGSKGAGKFVLPGLIKIEKKKVPARKARKGVANPFKPGETMDIPAKPAYTKVVVRALKSLKEMG